MTRVENPAREHITGVVLAGGLGRRMSTDGQGVDKGLIDFRGRPLVAHAIERLAPQVDALLVNANRNLDRYAPFGYPLVSDSVGGFAGPLAGLHAAMHVSNTPWLAIAPCDSPFLPLDLVDRLWQGLRSGGTPAARIAVASAGGRSQPVFALIERKLLPNLEAFLASGERKIGAWYASVPAAIVAFDDAGAFCNLNTLDDLSIADSDR